MDVVPWDTDLKAQQYDALFLSNGPGDPQVWHNFFYPLPTQTDSVRSAFSSCFMVLFYGFPVMFLKPECFDGLGKNKSTENISKRL